MFTRLGGVIVIVVVSTEESRVLLTEELLKQGYVTPRLKSSLQKFYDEKHGPQQQPEVNQCVLGRASSSCFL
jgi:hypothetical protein